jgi:threonine/homoserine/homoserine lactone efflux protein
MVAVLPQFVVVSAGAVTEQLLILGAVFALIALASDSLWAFFAGTARDWFTRSPRRLEIAESAGGAGMVGVGVTLALSGQSK